MRRPLLALLALATALPVTAADAAPKRKPKPVTYCRLVTDPAGDASGLAAGQAHPAGDTGLDVIGADLATSATTATVVFRLQKVNQTDSMAPTGRSFALSFQPKGKPVSTVTVVVSETGITPAGAILDADKNEIRVSLPLAEAGLAGVKAATPITAFRVVTRRWAGAAEAGAGQSVGDDVDVATSPATYPAAGKSCVVVGR